MELIIFICLILIISYFFDLISIHIKIPSVFLLILLGLILKLILKYYKFSFTNLDEGIVVLGTLGLILIVQEAALEIEFKKEKMKTILKAFFSALFQLSIQVFIFSSFFLFLFKYDLKTSLLNAIPISVISSAVAISSVKNFREFEKEFIVYESAFSDILGILLFDFVYFNENFHLNIIKDIFLNVLIVFVFSLFAILILLHLLNKIIHPVKFIPILLIMVSFYALAKLYHYPSLLFILFFGFSLSNINKIIPEKLKAKINLENLNLEVEKYKTISFEMTYLIRSLFFILFGFSFKILEIFNIKGFSISILIILIIYLTRYIILWVLKIAREKTLFMAPRGLITIILFLSLDEKFKITFIDKTLILQLIIISIFLTLIETFKKENPIKNQGSN